MRASGPVERAVGQLSPLVHSLDHLVCSKQERCRDREAGGPGGLEVDDQFELGRLLDGQITRSTLFNERAVHDFRRTWEREGA